MSRSAMTGVEKLRYIGVLDPSLHSPGSMPRDCVVDCPRRSDRTFYSEQKCPSLSHQRLGSTRHVVYNTRPILSPSLTPFIYTYLSIP